MARDDIRLAEATESDIPILVEFLSELFSIEADFTPNPEQQADALSLILSNPDQATIYVVRVGQETAGMIALHLAISTAEGCWVGRLEDVYIKPEFRGRGIGTRAIQQLVDIARDRGLKRVTLAADKDNLPALGFYRACGFTEMNLTTLILRTGQ